MYLTKKLFICLIVCLLSLTVLISACQGRIESPKTTPATTPTVPSQPSTTISPESTTTASIEEKLGLHATDSTGDKKYLVVLADFTDVKRQYPVDTISYRMGDLLGPYFKEASYNKLKLEGDVIGPYILPHPVAYYRISPCNLEIDPTKVTAIVTDVVNAANKDVDLYQYSYILVGLGATQPDYGMVGYCALPGMLGFKSNKEIKSASGKDIENLAVFCENAHMGTFIHDTIHMIGGYIGDQRLTPCLYDHDLQKLYPTGDDAYKILINMGFWDPLSSHFPYNKELPPSGLSSWTKLRLNWIDPDKITLVKAGQTATVELDPLLSPDASTYVIRIPITDKTYYLVENRQKIGSDANLPTTGILIMYADDTIYECRHGEAPVKIMDANPSVPYMNDATYDIGKEESYIDTKNNIAIILQKKDGQSYQIQVTTADKAK
jgi:M6 family metalloprotease-like protein